MARIMTAGAKNAKEATATGSTVHVHGSGGNSGEVGGGAH